MIRWLLAPLLVAGPAMAGDEGREDFITANMLATFYHELAHALIDVADLPVLGREEDAADALSALLIDDIWDEETATDFTRQTAKAWRLYAAEAEASGEPMPYWDTHSLDMQRYYNHVCLFYGAKPEERAALVEELGLPPDRAEGCAEEHDLASASWVAMFEGLEAGRNPHALRMVSANDVSAWAPLVAQEVVDLNKLYSLPEEITVSVEACGEANAFYNPDERRIRLCTEYADDLGRLFDENP